MNPRIIIESLSMDLLRIALGLYRCSSSMTERFKIEALKRGRELKSFSLEDPYTQSIILKVEKSIKDNSPNQAEKLLMYSVLLKNLAKFKYTPPRQTTSCEAKP